MANARDEIRCVTDKELTKQPYCSVGEIGGLTRSNEWYSATGFYIGNGKIVTAAHFFDQVIPLTVKFVPAKRNRHDIYGDLYGHYQVVEPTPSPDYLLGQWTNDICSAKIQDGRKRVKTTTGKLVFETANIADLIPLPIGAYHPRICREWIVLGYGYESRMMEIKGLQRNQERVLEELNLEQNFHVPPIGGAPWIRLENFQQPLATGMSSGINISYSAHISEELLG